jgi:thiamine biosynthesis lipoprotein
MTVKVSGNRAGGGRLSSDEIDEISSAVASKAAELDLALSASNKYSEIYALNHSVNVLISENEALHAMLDSAHTVESLTGGAYTCTAGALDELWDEDLGILPNEEEIAEALSHVGCEKISRTDKTIRKNDTAAKIDSDRIACGIAVQKLLEYIASTESACGVVAVGNTVGVYGEKSKHSTFKIGVKDPVGEPLGDFYTASGFISTSSVNDSFFTVNGKKYHDIIDPRTGSPAETGILEAIVYTSNGASSAALSHALFVLGIDGSMELYEKGEISFEAIFVTEAGEVILTPGITEDTFTLTSKNYKIKTEISE